MQVHGEWDKRFEPLVSAFRQNFADKYEAGAAVCVYQRGAKVVDIWAGLSNRTNSEQWHEDTLVPVFSVTKALASLSFLILARRGKFDYEKPVAHYWPDFAIAGKKDITCRQLLEHRAGLYSLNTPLELSDFRDNYPRVYRALIMQKPLFVPGSGQAYGAQIWGAYAGELFRHVAHESLGQFFAREVARKLDTDAFIGLPPQHDHQVAKLYPVSTFDRLTALVPDLLLGNTTEGRVARAFIAGDRSIERAYMNPALGSGGLEVFNETWVHRLELPWANGIANARSLATIMNVLALGGRVGKTQFADAELMRQLTKPNPLRYDLVLRKRLGWNLGFLKEEPELYSPHSEAFGHSGMGGPVTFADPKTRTAFAYVCNKMDYKIRPDKTLRLCKALYESLG
ncbi:MAG TPA: serine hydrolase domain-containing protein [Turneriella sp.]|nr:serine hydrolase domain-containing protein [Turneriella sp.]HNE19376.1 serine hydrolase domain-containing protein [Turneriella sp.]HNJ65276.1 serine hydrolase domain-containing protein [Turneriella sp.]HNL10026.1 serine hydrolase domain-containing protein [Turneriella sp.]HNL54788.1 serine hydrolase domain-containing protein [Turneriella sp.]